ncbi:MAG: hypothetical protein ACHP7H_00650 [Hyphomicrobiales bacterium]
MLPALAVVLVFVAGFASGGLAIFSVLRYAFSTPKHAMTMLEEILNTANASRWVDLSPLEAHAVIRLRCPSCGHTQTSDKVTP